MGTVLNEEHTKPNRITAPDTFLNQEYDCKSKTKE